MKRFELKEANKREKLVCRLPCPVETEITKVVKGAVKKTNTEKERLKYSMHRKFEKLVKSEIRGRGRKR